ncbi:coat protein [Potato necrosis virus]|uniref:Capsid protein n=1 Tax=Potato necrosis virus TaxID=1725329 RepID=A0A141G5J0_9TOMB|nr:coat protein [Potato necrosis virus]ALF95244.1 coat protein [Potato necrosis virus]
MPKRGTYSLSDTLQRKSKKQKESEYNAFQREKMDRLVSTIAPKNGGSGMMFRTVTAPVTGSVVYSRPRVPNIRTSNMSTVVCNTELVANISTSALGAFSFTAQPLIPSFGAWLANIGDLYSKFRWISCSVIYIPKCPTSTQGSVCMAIVYDAQDTTPTSRLQLSQCYQSITFPPYAGYGGASALNSRSSGGESLVSTLDVSRVDKKWYSTIGNAAFTSLTSIDKNQFCPATALIASDGGPATATAVGDVFMRYEIEFIEPINPTLNV